MDQAVNPSERTIYEAHLATCSTCQEQSQLIREWTGSLASALDRSDSAVDLPHDLKVPRRTGWRAAAVIILIASAALGVPPLRAVIIEAGGRAWTSISQRLGIGVVVRTAAELPRVLTRPEGPDFTVILPPDSTAALEIEVVAGDSLAVTQTAAPHGHAGRLIMLPNAIQLGSRSDYLVQVPMSVRRLALRQGDSVIRTFRPSAVGQHWTVPLQTETVR